MVLGFWSWVSVRINQKRQRPKAKDLRPTLDDRKRKYLCYKTDEGSERYREHTSRHTSPEDGDA